MKRIIAYILFICLLLTYFTACKQEVKPTESKPQTQTDLSTPAVIDQQPKEEAEAVTDASQPIQEEVNEPTEQAEEPEETKPVSKPISKVESKLESKTEAKPASKPTSKPITQSSAPTSQPQNTPTVDPAKVHGDLAQNNPNFVSEQALQNWLQFGSGAYEAERAQCLTQANQASQCIIYTLTNGIPSFITLEKIELHASSGDYTYLCHFENGDFCQISIDSGATSELEEKLYNHAVELYQKGNEGSGLTSINGIDFYHDEKNGSSTHIYWKQFGKQHSVVFHGNQDRLEELIPHLVLQQVTIPLNTDLVTQ